MNNFVKDLSPTANLNAETPNSDQPGSTKKFWAVSLLLVTTFFWGVTFTIVKEAIEKVDVFVFLAQRFLLSFALLLPGCLIRRRHFSWPLLKRASILGLFLFASYAFQTLGLLYTSASNAGFLTGLNVVFVPVISAFLFRQLIPNNVRLGVILATAGLFLLCTDGTWLINRGDLLVILCAICVAWHLIFTGEYSRSHDVYWLTTFQLGVIALLSFLVARTKSLPVFVWYPELLWTMVICVLFATIFAFLVQTSMQRIISPSHTALIFCMEPVFAALYAYWAAGEKLRFFGLIGCVLIFAGMLLSEVVTFNKTQITFPPFHKGGRGRT
jgi:drug/metabolite transporter (DMT)-like permease